MIFVVCFGGMAFAGALILLMARYSPHPNAHRLERSGVIAGGLSMPADDFRALVIDLVDALKLDVVLLTDSKDHYDVLLRSNEPLTGGRYLMHAVYDAPGDLVDQTYLVKLADHAKADGAAKGILLTPYEILTDGLGNLEMPIELIDGKALRVLIEKYLPSERMMQVAKYRGFGM